MLCEAFERRARKVLAALAGVSGLSATMPQGGMFIMIDVSGTGMDGETFAWRLLEDHVVAVMPGNSFGATATGLIRLALCVPDDVLAMALDRLVACATSVPSPPKAFRI